MNNMKMSNSQEKIESISAVMCGYHRRCTSPMKIQADINLLIDLLPNILEILDDFVNHRWVLDQVHGRTRAKFVGREAVLVVHDVLDVVLDVGACCLAGNPAVHTDFITYFAA